MYDQIFDLAYYGNGAFQYVDIFNWPVWLRNYNYKRLSEKKDKESKEIEKVTKNSKLKK